MNVLHARQTSYDVKCLKTKKRLLSDILILILRHFVFITFDPIDENSDLKIVTFYRRILCKEREGNCCRLVVVLNHLCQHICMMLNVTAFHV